MQTFFVKDTEFTSNLTDDEAAKAVEGREDDFARSLCWHHQHGRLSVKQRAWLHWLAKGAAQEQDNQQLFTTVVALLDTARDNGLKWPAVTTLRLRLSFSRSNEVNVTSDNRQQFYGRIGRDGRFRGVAPQEVMEELAAIDADPAELARRHGELTGQCCFCNTTLSTDESLAVGYGPVCAKHWGLPWGKKMVKEQTAAA